MSKWEVVDKSGAGATNLIMNACTLGAYGLLGRSTSNYTIKNTDTGETKSVQAEDSDELGSRIANGDFDD
jgi:hypothetical protein